MIELKIDQPNRDAMQVAADHLDELQRLNAAVDTSAVAVFAAQADYEARASERASMEADLAMVDPADAKALETKIRKLSTGVDEARNLLERQERVAAALTTRLLEAENRLPEELARLQTAMSKHSTSVAEAVYSDVVNACGPLLEALRVAQVAHLAVVNPNLGRTLNEVRIPVFGYIDSNLIEGRKHLSSDGAWVDISQGWEADEKLAALHAAASEPRNLLAKVKAYKTRAERLKPPASHERKSIEVRTWPQSTAPVVRAPAHAPQASSGRPTAARAPIAPVDLNVGSRALADPAFAQFR